MSEPTITEITINSFDPFTVSLPEGKQLVGKVRIVLPPIHVQVYDLSMGLDLLKGAHLGSDASIFGWNIDLPEPVDTGKFMQFLVESQDTFRESWKVAQAEFDKRGALLA